MNHKFSILVFLIFKLSTIWGVSLITDSSNILKPGIYRNFNEFKFNSPSVEFKYQVKERVTRIGLIFNMGEVESYAIEIDRWEAKKIGKVYGFCDGNYVYINPYFSLLEHNAVLGKMLSANSVFSMDNNGYGLNVNIGGDYKYRRLELLGRYCYFKKIGEKNVGGYQQNTTIRHVEENVLDIKDGEITVLDKKGTKKILKVDSELYKEYKRAKKKKKKRKEYLIKFMERNEYQDQQKIFFPFNSGLVDSLIYKLDTDSSYNYYYDRILSYKYDPIFYNIELRESLYKNGNYKYIGLKAKHSKGNNPDYFYKIGTWIFYHKNGKIKEIVNYNLKEEKNGKNLLYGENGNLIEEKNYLNGKMIE